MSLPGQGGGPSVDEKYRSRKFLLASLFTTAGVIALFAEKMTGGEFIGLSGTVLALYGAANLMDKSE